MKLGQYMPLAIFAIVAIAFGVGLGLNPKEIQSARVGKPVPSFQLAGLDGGEGFSSDDLAKGRYVVNVFASWCIPCRAEHPLLMDLQARGVTIMGINYKDHAEDAIAFLEELDDPYSKTGADLSGRVGIDWGVSGVPESFFVVDGMIIDQHIGPLTQDIVNKRVLPAMGLKP